MIPCPSCRRHVRDALCPFCGASVPALSRSSLPVGGRTRAMLAFGAAAATVGTALGACSTNSAFAPPYGQPAFDSGGSAFGARNDAGADADTLQIADASVNDEDAIAGEDGGTTTDAASSDAADQ